MADATPTARKTAEEMDGVRTLNIPALVSPDSSVPLRVFVPDRAAREAVPNTAKQSCRSAALGVLAAREARECGYCPRKVLEIEPDPDGRVVKLEVDADV